jgi:DNA integrity scanning protein DisA with diadenylate cyclase activity
MEIEIKDKKLEQALIDVALKICKQKKGCLLIVMNNKFDYSCLIEQDIKSFNIFDNLRRVEPLAMYDGACIFNPEGYLIAYAAQVLNVKPSGYGGTRHQAAYTASINNNLVVMSSEEDQKVRLFQNGKLILQIDALEKNIESNTKEALSILESIGAGTISAIGVAALLPMVGITLVPGILIFSSAHYSFKFIGELLNKKNKFIN